MTEKQLRQSYIESGIVEYTGVSPLLLAILISVAGIVIFLSIIAICLKRGQDTFLSFLVSTIVTTVWVLVMFVIIAKLTPENDHREYFHQWKVINFEEKYLEAEAKELYIIKDYQIQPDGTPLLFLEEKASELSVRNTSSLTYVDTGLSYIKAVRVEGLTDIGIEDGLYNTEVYLAKPHPPHK